MYFKHHTKGIVASSRIEGDCGKRADIFTEKFGLVSARVQGARNIHSKLRGGVQDFSSGEFSLVHGKSGWRVVSIRSEKNFFELFRNSPVKLKIAANVLNLVKKLTSEEENYNFYNSVFNIVIKFFNFLTAAREDDVALAECLTLVRILHSLGYMRHDPQLLIPISSAEIEIKDLETIAPRRSKIIQLINESLKAA